MRAMAGWLLIAVPAAALGQPLIEEVVVRAHPLSAESLVQPHTLLDDETLTRDLDATLGAVVARQPGIHSSFYGQAVGRPVIHGLAGPRVRVLEDRIASLDASVLSDDHAVGIEPYLADDIEIIRGPATLIYGAGAIGGVVDVHTGRIPHDVPERSIGGRLEGRLDDVADQRSGAVRLDGGSGALAWHVDGFRRRLDDYDIPGFARSAALRRAGAHDHDDHDDDDHDHDEPADDAWGRLPNSDLISSGGSLGFSSIGERGFIGLSVSRYRAEYGLPGGLHVHGEVDQDDHEDHDAAGHGGVRIDLRQTRWTLEAALQDPLPHITHLNVRLGRSDYRHEELEGHRVGTVFDVDAWEGRIEAVHAVLAGWEGVVGTQFGREKASALGEEAFTPPSVTETGALFVLEERVFERLTLQAGARLERARVKADGHSGERFDTFSVSAGLMLPLADTWALSLATDYAGRAPTASELYADGPHLATQSYELGDPDLDVERATSLSATLRHTGERLEGSLTLYAIRFRDFIFQADTGAVDHGLPVRRWTQEDADFRGLDLEARFKLLQNAPLALDARLLYDRVRARLDVSGNDHLPRLAPARAGMGLEARWRWLSADLEYFRVMKQNDTAAHELPTDGYGDLRARLAAHVEWGDTALMLFVQGRNLGNDEQRNHLSFLKDHAPLPGRTLLAGVRLGF